MLWTVIPAIISDSMIPCDTSAQLVAIVNESVDSQWCLDETYQMISYAYTNNRQLVTVVEVTLLYDSLLMTVM